MPRNREMLDSRTVHTMGGNVHGVCRALRSATSTSNGATVYPRSESSAAAVPAT